MKYKKNIFILLFIFLSVTPFLETLGKSILYFILSFLILLKQKFLNNKDFVKLFILFIFIFVIANCNDILYSNFFYLNIMNVLFLFNIFVGFILAQNFKKTSQEYSLNQYTINRIVPPS
jgi:hypothetical protein